MAERQNRVRNGSRRRRDLQAVGAPSLQNQADRLRADRAREAVERREREERQRPKVAASDSAATAWVATAAELAEQLQGSTYRIWFEPLECIGEVDGALALEGTERQVAWLSLRYGSMLGGAVRARTDYRGVFLFTAAPTPGEGLL